MTEHYPKTSRSRTNTSSSFCLHKLRTFHLCHAWIGWGLYEGISTWMLAITRIDPCILQGKTGRYWKNMTSHFSKQVRPKLSATKKCLNLFDLLSPGRLQHVWHHKLGTNNFACSEVSWVYSKLSGTWSFERSSMFTTCWERCKAQCHRGTEAVDG